MFLFWPLRLLCTVALAVPTARSGAFAAEVSPESLVSVASSNGGVYIGRRTADGAVDAFLGIRYADPGTERFQPSSVVSSDKDGPSVTINATEPGPRCVQASFFGPPEAPPQSEDCLYLNLWRPADHDVSSEGLLPVMVWIHGGGWFSGSSSDAVHDGSNLAAKGRVIVVAPNYRLGVFGFLVTGGANSTGGGNGGMNGVFDQINALRWVKDHAATFGGDTDSVTVFGESAGGVAACLLSVSPQAITASSGLFQRTIVQSGQCISERLGPMSAEAAAMNTKKLLEFVGAESVEGLNNLTAEELLTASFAYGGSMFTPAMDGLVMPKHPAELYRQGMVHPRDYIIGSTTYDDASLLGFPPRPYIARAAQFEDYVHDQFPDDEEGAARVVDAYSPALVYNGSNVSAYAQFNGDFFFRCFSRELAALVADKVDGSAYLFNFAHLSSGDLAVTNGLLDMAGIDDDPTWASHTAEIPFVFGNLDQTYTGPALAPPTDTDVALSDEMLARWARFAWTGDPNADGSGEGGSGLANWTAVLPDIPLPGAGGPTPEATDAPFLSLRAGGGAMLTSSEKTGQCSSIPGVANVRNDDSNGSGGSDGPIAPPSTTVAPTSTPTTEPTTDPIDDVDGGRTSPRSSSNGDVLCMGRLAVLVATCSFVVCFFWF